MSRNEQRPTEQAQSESQAASLVESAFPHLDRMSASVYAADLRTGDPIVTANPHVPLLPASNAKLVTAARAFDELGPSYRFETTLHADGAVQEGHLLGDLVLTGSGAADLSQGDLLALAEAVAEAGIDTVAGELVIDASAFDHQSLGPGWTWDDGQFEYGAKSTPLALERNTVDITVSHRNGSVTVDASPTSEIVRIESDVTTGPTEELEVYKKRASEVIRVEGQIPPGETTVEASPVDDPMMHAGSLLRQALESTGVTIDGWTRIEHEPVDTDGPPCAVVESSPLSAQVRTMLVTSDNFVAEQLARTVALELEGEGSWDAWETHVTDFLEARGADAVRLRDGSGLSRYNLLSAASIAAVLEWSLDQPWGDRYRSSLPLAGVEGTVSNRLEAAPLPVRAKTGTLTGVRTFSGYVEDRENEPAIVFSCLLSNLTGDQEASATDRIDDLVESIIETAALE
ncbi:D-alanyl-D-alanine carboxypeptidase/D-alanyl-D-alanine endopeptidase [Natrialba sp. SSL1]|uniref:D-alanyl-D-alanine carboxypeptidase/D-alanyl-D-alanine endopeptidase n=1 Tax=Natrialba sp. SSL1 TaxID=1869245 RepID=UPI0008F8ECA1|nr:D-alanyl-D-alanine carboxypeptidase/D-alanyl-D-alanine-endopeptidase [Natrialba sp. SSL1]OIB58078.1 D-alanyl-D-alanine carboxypeptidase/D-alanyl-D-alanine-endopeptidase [Natrialba sp. SSL1]